MSEDTDRARKQEFLQNEIIAKNFNVDAFTAFCEEKRSADIDHWTLEELMECVGEFKSIHQFLPATIQVREESKSPSGPSPNVYSIAAMKALDTELSQVEEVQTTLQNPEIASGGIFGSKHFTFTLRTAPFNWEVTRTLEDFTWLRTCLSNAFPAVFVPPPPPKRVRNSNDPANLTKQHSYLQRFIDSINKNKLFRTSSYLVAFLKDNDAKNFDKVKKAGSKHKRPTRFDDFWSISGVLNSDPAENKEKDKDIRDYLTYTENLRKKLKRQTDTLIQKIVEVSKEFQEISITFDSLERTQQKFPEIPANFPMYNALRITFEKWAQLEFEASEFIQLYLNNFFKYSYQETGSLREILKERDSKLQALGKNENKLNMKKERMWSTGNVSNWGLQPDIQKNESIVKDKSAVFQHMFPNETNTVNLLKNEFGFYNYQYFHETKRLFLENQDVENKHFKKMSQAMIHHLGKLQNVWGNLEKVTDQIREEFLS